MFVKLKRLTIQLFTLQLLFHQINAFTEPPPPAILYDKMFDAINRLSQHMEMFNVHYITKLDEKFVAIMQILSGLDANVKQLQERAQSWDTFSHHMTAWSDHIKSSDQKMEIVKKNLENLPIIEKQLQNTDFKVQHIFEKTDLINEKFHEVTRMLQNVSNKQVKKKEGKSGAKFARSQEDFESTEILLRLSKIQRILQNTCSTMRLDKEFENSNNNYDESTSDLKALISQMSVNIEKLPIKEIKQSFNLIRKHDKALEVLTATVNHIDERTVRIFDTNSYQFKKLLSNFKGTEEEVLTFTNNANILLKKVERTIRQIQNEGGVDKCHNGTHAVNELPYEGDSTETDGDEIMDQKEYTQPNKTNCFQLTTGSSGVYLFGDERKLNEGGRDFYQKYCEYSTEGTAWTVIQRRNNFEPREHFNRSWSEFKHGFGNLTRDFWFGNEFVHNLTSQHSMVLRIVLEDFKDNHVWIEYGSFKMENENSSYKLIIDEYRGAVADSMLDLNQCSFRTFDKFNDSNRTVDLVNGWWSSVDGHPESNLNGIYRNEPLENNSSAEGGIFWKNWIGNAPLKATKMMIRPKDVWFSNSSEDYTQFDDFF